MVKLKEKIEKIGLVYKNEIIKLIVFNFVLIAITIASYIFLKNMIVLAFALVFLVLFNYLFLTRYKSIEQKKESDITNEFISLLPFFKTYLENNFNVYASLNELINFSSDALAFRLTRLIDSINEDKSIKPFINFSKLFHSNQIEQFMICIYQMVDDGNSTRYITQFENTFNNLRNSLYQSKLEKKEKSLSSMTLFPLLGSSLLIVMITFGIISIIGEMINGI